MVDGGRTIFRVREPSAVTRHLGSSRPRPRLAHADGIFAMCSCMEEQSSGSLSPAECTTDARNITSQGSLPCDYAWKNNLPCLARLVGTKPFRTIRWRQTFEQRSIMYSYLPSLAVNPPPPSKRRSSALIYISMSTVLIMSLGGVKCSIRTHGSRSHPSFSFPVLLPPIGIHHPEQRRFWAQRRFLLYALIPHWPHLYLLEA